VSRTYSPVGRNAAFCYLHYDPCIDNLFDIKLSSYYCFALFKSANLLVRVNAVCEAIPKTDGRPICALHMANVNHSSANELNFFIESLAVDLN
jgi:hypothetical protein